MSIKGSQSLDPISLNRSEEEGGNDGKVLSKMMERRERQKENRKETRKRMEQLRKLEEETEELEGLADEKLRKIAKFNSHSLRYG